MNTLAAMRAEFDDVFREAVQAEPDATRDFLAIRLGPDPYAISIDDISGVFADRRITFIASPDPVFLGIAGLRGAVVPVYDLCALLGYPPVAQPRWLLAIGGTRLALAFETLDRHLRLPSSALTPHTHAEQSHRFVYEMLQGPEGARSVVRIAAISHFIEHSRATPRAS